MDEPACTVGCAAVQDIPAMLSIEKKYFDTCWQSKTNTLKNLIEKDPKMFRLCKVDNKLKGYYGILPLPYEIWKKVLRGQILEDDAIPYLLSFEAPDVYLYIYSVIVDLSDKQHKTYTRKLIRDFARQFILGQKRIMANIKAVGAFTVSEGGRRLVERSKFIYKGSFLGNNGLYVRSYAIKRENLLQQALKIREQHAQKRIA
ncbi:MAG: hypothetical protein WC109_02400 [Syntrophomonadaceae bacterium]|nr:hypothetical protein [Syntrophomonadaceae bacterium]MDD3271303.1 hypothetical protein [Syntrophomonadaceae bacterium]MDD3898137.1 hypothetical protein [Syntrophomonadaceae bacterium]MDD4562901.1 hypothetical protein [Syntrophomonadaceae bacterium]